MYIFYFITIVLVEWIKILINFDYVFRVMINMNNIIISESKYI
jgi:hypothetical protein